MAQGQVVNALSSVSHTQFVDIKPGTGVEWAIHNIYYSGGNVDFYLTNGTDLLKFGSDSTAGTLSGDIVFHVTNSIWIRVTNTSGGTLLIGYDGVQTSA